MKAFLSKNIFTIAGLLVGATAGYAYWYFVGCQGGTCPIYAVWYRSTAYGAVMGALLGMIVVDMIPKKKANGSEGAETPEEGKSEFQ